MFRPPAAEGPGTRRWVLSGDQDYSEVAVETRAIAQERGRWIKLASAFPLQPNQPKQSLATPPLPTEAPSFLRLLLRKARTVERKACPHVSGRVFLFFDGEIELRPPPAKEPAALIPIWTTPEHCFHAGLAAAHEDPPATTSPTKDEALPPFWRCSRRLST